MQTLNGAALDTTLAFALSADGLTFTLKDNQNWPDGGVGYFIVLMEDGTAKKEYLLCSRRVGTLVTVSQRGYFGTTGVVHATTAAVVAYDVDANISSSKGLNLTLLGLLKESYTDGITAYAGGGKTNAVKLISQVNRIATVATAADSIKLPDSAPGLQVTVINHGASSLQIFGAGTDEIDDAATGTGIAQAADRVVIYSCATAGEWYSNKLGSGSVTTGMILDGTIVNADISASAGIALSKLASDPLARANHTGTQTASTVSDFDTQVRLSRLDQMAAPAASVPLNAQKITGLADPTLIQDAATKGYTDAIKQGLDIKDSVRVASTANIAIASALIDASVIDDITVATGNRVLLKNQTAGAENGIYVVVASGVASRSTDTDISSEVTSGLYTFVSEGTASSSMGFVLTTADPITLGTTSLSFTQFSGAGQITAGAGLTKTGNTLDAVGTANRIVVNANDIDIGTDVVTLTGAQTLTDKTHSDTTTTFRAVGDATKTIRTLLSGMTTSVLGILAFTFTTAKTITFPDATGTVALTSDIPAAYTAPTIGSTSIGSGATVTTIAGLTLTTPVLTGAVTNAVVANSGDGYGFVGTPQISTAVDIDIIASHMGKQIYFTVTGKIATIPANGTIAIQIGSSFTVVNDTGVSSTIAITTDTLILANSATTGTRTLAAYGVAVFTKVTATKWIGSGNGLT